MRTMLVPRERDSDGSDAGFTLIELAVSMAIMGILMAVITTTVTGSKKSADTVRQINNLNEEARLALNRISRELRQAKEVSSVVGTDGATGFTFGVDFDGNGSIDTSSVDPERLTYRWDAAAKKILLSAADTAGTTVTQPILSGEVSAFQLQYRSSKYKYDSCILADGVTTWQELDKAGCGPGNGNGVLDSGELPYIDSVVVSFSVLEGSRQQDYRTQVDLRNAL